MRRAGLTVLLAALAAAAPALALDTFSCGNWKNDPDGAIGACTAALGELRMHGSAYHLDKGRNLAWAYFNRGSAYGEKGDYDKAVADLTQAIQNKPDAAIYNNRGVVQLKRGNAKAARSDFTEAARLDPTSEVARRNLARLEEPMPPQPTSVASNLDVCIGQRDGTPDKMLVACDAVVLDDAATASQRASALTSRARMLARQGMLDDASADLQRAMALQPGVASYRAAYDALQAQRSGATEGSATLVRRAQAALARLGYPVGPADGKAGPKTQEAIRLFQERRGLTNGDGITETLVVAIESQS